MVFCLFFSVVGQGQQDATVLINAEQALSRGAFDEVLKLLNGAAANNLQYFYLKGLALEGLDSVPEAEDYWLTYLDLAEAVEEEVYHRSLGHFCLANNYLLRGEWAAAEQSLNISRGAIAALPDTLSAKIWNSYGVLRLELNEQEEALNAFQKAVGYWERAGLARRALLPRFYLARLLLWRDPTAAAREVEQLMEIPVTPLDDLHPAVAGLTLCEIYLRLGKVGEARRAFGVAEARIEAFKGRRQFTELAYQQSVKGLLHLGEGRIDLAVKAFKTVDTIDRVSKLLPKGEVLYFEGLSLQYAGRFKDAIKTYELVLATISFDNQQLRATVYQHLGESHLGQNSFNLALDYLTSANTLWNEFGEDGGAQTKLLMAEALLGNRDTSAAEQLLEVTAEYCLQDGGIGGGTEVCLRLGEVLLQNGKDGAAKRVLDGLKMNKQDLSGLNRARWLAGLANVEWGEGKLDRASALSEQSVDALLEHWSALKGMEGLRLQRNYFDRIFRLGISCSLARGDANQALWLAEVARGLDLKGDLLAELPGKRLTKQLNYTNKVAAKLDDRQLLVYYLKGMTKLYAVVVDETGKTEILTLGDAWALEALVNRYLNYLADSVTSLDLKKEIAAVVYGKVCALSHSLYEQLVEPLALPVSAELFVVADGSLHFLSFASLLKTMPTNPVVFQTHDYLIRHHAFAYLPTVALLLEPREGGAIAAYPFAAFAPSYGPGAELSALLNNESEVARLEANFVGDYHYGTEATREMLPDSLVAEGQLLHLGMHAVFNPEFPDSSLLAFAGAEIRGKAAWYYGREVESGFGAYPFVFLSACQTANGKYYRGEGPLSLTRSVMASGSKHVVSSLWNVDDGRVGKLIENFYGSLEEDGNSIRALRAAQLDYLAEANWITAYPYYWSGFLHYGVSARVKPKARLNYWYLLSGIILVVLLSAGIYHYR